MGRLAGLWVVLSFTANAKFYHAIQIILYLELCDQSLVAISVTEVIITSIL